MIHMNNYLVFNGEVVEERNDKGVETRSTTYAMHRTKTGWMNIFVLCLFFNPTPERIEEELNIPTY